MNKNKEEAKRGSLIQSTTIRRRAGLHLGRNPKRRGWLTTYYLDYTISCGHSQPPTKRGRPIPRKGEATYP